MNSRPKEIAPANNTIEEFPPRLAQLWEEARGRLWHYILAFFAGAVLVATLTGFHIWEKEKAALAYWQDQEWTIVDDRARQISNWLGERRANAELLSSYLSVQQLLGAVEKSGSSGVFQTSAREPLSVLLHQFAFTCGYAGIYLLTPEGRVVAQSANAAGTSPAVLERARMVSRGRAFWVGPLGETQANSFVYFISPIFARAGAGSPRRLPVPRLRGDHKGRPDNALSSSCLGVLAFQIDPKRSLLPILLAERVATRSGETLLLRREGDEVVFLSPLRGAPLIQGFLRRPLSVLEPKTGQEAEPLSGERLDYRGVPVLSAERRLPLTDWILVSKIDRDEALEDFYQRARLEAVVGACLVLVFAYVLVGSRRKRLARALAARVAQQQTILAILAYAQQMVDNVPAGLLILSHDLNVLSANRTFLEAFHLRPEEVIGRPLPEVVHAEGPPRRVMGATGPGGGPRDVLVNLAVPGEAGPRPARLTLTEVSSEQGKGRLLLSVEDLTESERLRTAAERLEQQLRQAQKMEAVGRLAGGVAHDFNNMLTIISGYGGLLLDHPSIFEPLRGYVNEIKNASTRAASLTRQLLAFSRQQVLAPRVLALNAVVANIEKMLKRLIGEDIELVTILGESLWPVKADPGQLEQVLLNLAVNARDAMPSGGVLTIETANVEMDSASAQAHFPLPPGRYVLLAFSDTGIGMDAETQTRIFDPFFTTKEKGKGTGLGLAMVYGIVKQSGGYIWVNSEVGKGTTFKIYLPRTEAEVDVSGPLRSAFEAQQGTETLLLVEDEDAVRALVRNVLREKGYRILEACRGEEALELAEQYGGPIDLLVTDVVMPQMNGRELARRLITLLPQIKVLYISGYADSAVWHQGGPDSGGAFLQKPFSPEALARKVREILGGPAHRHL
jgi:signal transduction histidine kinase